MQFEVIKPGLLNTDKVQAFFSLKNFEYTEGKILGLNLGINTEDSLERAERNRKELLESLGWQHASVALARQVHGNSVIEINSPGTYDAVDGLVTTAKGLALAIHVADCACVLLADQTAGVVGACHAGWRGAVSGVLSEMVERMKSLSADPKRIKTYVSACISAQNFEVGEEVAALFPEEHVIRKDDERPHVNLSGYLRDQLLENGVLPIHMEVEKSCTFGEPERFYSYRREGLKSGRMAGFIRITG